MMTARPALPSPPPEYDAPYMHDLASLVVDEAGHAAKTDRDNVFERGSLILKAPDGGFWKLTVSNAGALSASTVSTDSDGRPITGGNPYT